MDNVSISRFDLTNAGICSALAELGGDIMSGDGRGSSSQWMNSVFSHIIPRLNSTSEMEFDSNGKRCGSSEGVAANTLLKVLSRLLLPRGFHHGSDFGRLRQNYLLNNPLKRHELLEAFAGAFFPSLAIPSEFERKEQSGSLIYTSPVTQKIEQLASTEMGITAAKLLTTLIVQSADHLLDPPNGDSNKLHGKNSVLLLQMSSILPVYLVSWEGRLPIESGLVLSSFTAIVRQWSELTVGTASDGSTTSTKKALNDLCLGFRFTLEALYTATKKKPSIFERYPEQVQKLCAGLIGLVKCPSEALAKSLSNICSKSLAPNRVSNASGEAAVISSNMANYVAEVMHSLRKTMPMAMYLTFLIDSSGMNHTFSITNMHLLKATKDGGAATDPVSEFVFSYDRAIGQLCRFLTNSCDQASTKVLPMIRPILQKWLSANSASANDVIKRFVQARAAITIIAAFTWDEVLSNPPHGESDFIAPKFLKLDEKLDQLLIDCIINQFELSARICLMERNDNVDDSMVQQQYLARLLGPITVLLRYRPGMCGRFAEEIHKRVVQQSQDTPQQEEGTPSGKDSSVTGREGTPSNKINTTEVHLEALLLVLKSKVPVSVADLVRSSNDLQDTLVSAAGGIHKSVSGGYLAHLGNKLLHQAKLCKQ